MSRAIYLEVGGSPRPKGSVSAFPIARKNGKMGAVVTHTAKSKVWEKVIRDHVQRVLGAELKTIVGAVSVELIFFLSRPKSVVRPYPSVPPDVDKLERAVLDAIKGLFEDDARVVDLESRKRYATDEFPEGVWIFVQEKVDSLEHEAILFRMIRDTRRAEFFPKNLHSEPEKI